MAEITCHHCGRKINQRPINEGGESYLTRLEVSGVDLDTVKNDKGGTSVLIGVGRVQRYYHVPCLLRAQELERPK